MRWDRRPATGRSLRRVTATVRNGASLAHLHAGAERSGLGRLGASLSSCPFGNSTERKPRARAHLEALLVRMAQS
jgi:hypothetical protein